MVSNLIQLPPEVILTICETWPPILPNLALTCRHLYGVLEPLIPWFRQLRDRYKSLGVVSLGNLWKETLFNSISDLLDAISRDPCIAEFITRLDLGESFCNDDDFAPRLAPFNPTCSMRVGDPFRRPQDISGAYPNEAMRSLFRTQVLLGTINTSFMFAVYSILSVVSNLTTLVLPVKWVPTGRPVSPTSSDGFDEEYMAVAFFEYLIELGNNSTLRNQPLQKLKVIECVGKLDNYDAVSMSDLFPFLALESVRECRVTNGQLENNRSTFGMYIKYPRLGVGLQTMVWTDCHVTSKHAKFLFRTMQQLRTLRFRYSMIEDNGFRFNANRFVRHLMAATGDTLEDFALTAGDLHSDTIDTSFFINSKVVVGEGEDYESDEGDDDIWGTEAVPQDDVIRRAYETDQQDENEGHEARRESKQKKMKADGAQSTSDAEHEGDEEVEEQDEEMKEQDGDGEEQDGDSQEWYTATDTDTDDEQDAASASGNITRWRLVSELPSTLNALAIHVPAEERNYRCLEAMLEGFDEQRALNLPLLETVEFYVRTTSRWNGPLVNFESSLAKLQALFANMKTTVVVLEEKGRSS